MKRTALLLTAAVAPFQLYAEAPRVVTDILPVHSLVAQVMEGVGTPDVIVPANASPHGFSMKVSQAQALENANVVFWIGEGLSPWLHDPLETLAKDAEIVTLMDAPGMSLLDFRGDHDHDHGDEEHAHDDHDHGDEEHAHDDHKHGDEEHAHDEHKHDEEEHAHDDHGEDKHAHDDHDHGDEEHAHDDHDHGDEEHAHKDDDHDHDHAHGDGHDPHVWLDPMNAIAIVNRAAQALSQADPENASTYFTNAAKAVSELEALDGEIAATLAPVKEVPFLVLHDAYQYFDARYDIAYEGSIHDVSGAAPGPQGLAATKAHLSEHNIACIFTEPQLNNSLVATVTEGEEVKLAEIDPLGADLQPGPALYGDLMRALAADMKACLE